jgi:ABC-type uncharacterized transport system substrate-binding protein
MGIFTKGRRTNLLLARCCRQELAFINPADLPVQTWTRYDSVLNSKTAKALGLDVPDSVRMRATEVIE